MTAQTLAPADITVAITVYGTPVGQGQVTFLGIGRGAKHTNEKTLKPWRRAIIDAALRATGGHEFTPYGDSDRCIRCTTPRKQHALFVAVPVRVELTVTVAKPKSAPKRTRTWPITRSSTDIDHHARSCLDALSKAGVVFDDSQVVELLVRKSYPLEGIDTLEKPGALIRVRQIGGAP